MRVLQNRLEDFSSIKYSSHFATPQYKCLAFQKISKYTLSVLRKKVIIFITQRIKNRLIFFNIRKPGCRFRKIIVRIIIIYFGNLAATQCTISHLSSKGMVYIGNQTDTVSCCNNNRFSRFCNTAKTITISL